MLEMDFDGALRYLCRALRGDPQDPRTLTALATLMHQRGKRRLARGLLSRAGKHADSVMAEDGFLTAAWAQDAWPEMEEYLAARMKRQPHRIPLLAAKATMHCEMGESDEARQLWREIIAIDPDDRSAATMLAAAQQGMLQLLCIPGMLPRDERRRQLTELRMAAESLPMTELLRPGSRERRLVDWFIVSAETTERQAVQTLLERNDPAVIPYLKELLCLPFLRHDVRQWALVRLAEMACREEMVILAGDHYTLIACQKVEESERPSLWGSFLLELLKETRRYGRSNDIAETAATLWRDMTEEERAHAGGTDRSLWCKAVEIYFLCMQGENAAAVCAMGEEALGQRRVRRIVRRIHCYMTKSSRPMPENGDTV
jgi:tetratricopeptide (TPR) repeat protein